MAAEERPDAMHEPAPPAAALTGAVSGPYHLDLKAERLRLEPVPVEGGGLRVSRRTFEYTETVTIPVREERVILECLPGTGPVRIGDRDLAEGETIEITVTRERVTVGREVVIEGGVALRIEDFVRDVRVEQTLRHEELLLQQDEPGGAEVIEIQGP
jgi:uncharacterized protein (TIGR02271 family)